MDDSSLLESTTVRSTPIGFEYVAMDDVPPPWREYCWAYLKDRRAQLIVDGVGPSVLIQDWLSWIESLATVVLNGDTPPAP